MSEPRALLNHARYLAAIQLAGWRAASGDAQAPAAWVLDAAYAPAVQLHLRHAYGWLLLAAARVTSPPEHPPGSVAELPRIAAGLSLPAEISHCEALERQGWLAELLAPLPATPRPAAGTLLASSAAMPTVAQCSDWCDAFDALVAVVDHAIDES